MEKTWKTALEQIADKVTAINFDLFVKTLTPEAFEDGTYILSATSTMVRDQASKEHIFSHIDSEIRECAPIVEKVRIIDAIEKEKRDQEKAGIKIIHKERPKGRSIPINPLKTFDTFIVGKSNELVAAAAEAVANNPGKRINPLFIYGSSGLGKTHLLNAIAFHLGTNYPELNVVFATCENFLNDFVDSIRYKTANEFRERYRNVDVLLIDDVHIIEDKKGTQEEFFHTFNDLYQNGKQIVLASDRHADKFVTLEERMRSRFKSGLIQDITSPDVEMRMAILEKKATLENHRLDPEIIEYLATAAYKQSMNVREMEGILFKVIFYAGLKNRPSPTLDDCREAIASAPEDRREQTTAADIIEKVCKYFNISKDDMVGKKRNREFVEPRMFAIYLITEVLNIPLVNIGGILGGRDHTTILHARNKIASQLSSGDARTKRVIEDLKSLISGN